MLITPLYFKPDYNYVNVFYLFDLLLLMFYAAAIFRHQISGKVCDVNLKYVLNMYEYRLVFLFL